MGLFDVIDDIAVRQVEKTETGDNRIFGVVIGTVMKNYNEKNPGRVCVSITTRDDKANVLKWARVAMPYSGKGWGQYFLPEEGDEVLIVFEEGNIEKPYIIGAIPKDQDDFLKKAVDKDNKFKKITTKHGSTITFTDGEDDKGGKDIIEIQTADKGHIFKLDNEKKQILISDKEGKNKIQMNTEKGEMNVMVEKKLTLKVGEQITVTMNGSNGTTNIETTKLNVDAKDSADIKANKQFSAKGAMLNLEGSANASLKGGPVTISGTPIKLG